MATNITCDRCGTTQQTVSIVSQFQSQTQPGWAKLTVKMVIHADPKADFLGGLADITNDICPACVLNMNLPVVENKLEMPTIDSLLADMVYDAVEELRE